MQVGYVAGGASALAAQGLTLAAQGLGLLPSQGLNLGAAAGQVTAGALGGALGGALSWGLGRLAAPFLNRAGADVLRSDRRWLFLGVHAVGGGLGGAGGDAIAQGVGLASGTQKEFDWGRLLWSGTTGLAAGLASAAGQWSALLHACFAAGTPILTPEGYKFIEDLRPGDLVLSRDENDPFGEVVPRVVEEVFQRTGRVLELTVGGRVIRTSDEHPFWVRGKGWTEAVALEVGDELSSHDGRWLAVEASTTDS
jgi:hypothetical protein